MSHRSMVMVKRTYLHIAVITLVSASIWLIISIYNAMTTPSAVVVDQAILTPINPKIDEAVLDLIIKREDVSQLPFVPNIPTQEKVSINEVAPLEESSTASESAVEQEGL